MFALINSFILSYSEFPSWIRPTVFSHLPVRWYAIMYLVAFAITYVLFRYQCRRGSLGGMNSEQTQDIFIWSIIGLIVGARVFSCLFYEASWYYWTHPWMMFWPWRNGEFVGLPGMSYHGGVIGGFLGCWLCTRKKYNFLDVTDTILAAVPLGYTFGRLGNFINGELWGRPTLSSYGMIFPDAPLLSTDLEWVRKACDAAGISWQGVWWVNVPRYPSQLYEAFGEGILLFVILWFGIRKLAGKFKTGPGLVTGCYLAGYGIIRFVIEYFREPDQQLGFIFLHFTLGQLLCSVMIISGILISIKALKTKPVEYGRRKKAHKGKKA